MNEFLIRLYEAAFSLPTEPFTWLMIPVTLYWALSFSGLFSLDWLDSADGALDGAVEGALDGAIDGAADGIAEGLTEGVGEAAADAAGESLSEALSAGDGIDAAHGGLDHAHGAVHSSPSFHRHIGSSDIPRTFSWSLMIVLSWVFSLVGTLYVPGFQALATKGLIVALLLAAGCFALAVGATGLAMRPLQRAMSSGGGTHSSELVGRTCTIRTQRVDRTFGQAEVDSGAMVIQIRSNDPDARLCFGGKAVIYEYDPEQSLYWVTPLEPELLES